MLFLFPVFIRIIFLDRADTRLSLSVCLSLCLYVTTQSLSTPPALALSLETPEEARSYHLMQYSFSLHFVKFYEEGGKNE